MENKNKALWSGLLGAVLLGTCIAAHAAEYGRLGQLVDDGAYQQAYDLGVSELGAGAGDPEFDFPFGLAAYHTSHYKEAVFAFERLVLLQPGNPRARLELARAYFASGDYVRAEDAFKAVLAVKPPPRVASRVQAYLDAIETRRRRERTNYSAFAGLQLGYDSNINSATARETTDAWFGTVALNENSQKTGSAFADLRMGGSVESPIDARRSLFAQATYENRSNTKTDDFNLDILGVTGGMQWRYTADRFRLPVRFQELYLGGERLRSFASVGGEWTHVLDKTYALTSFLQLGYSRFPDQESRNNYSSLVGFSLDHRRNARSPAFNLTAFAGDEEITTAGGEFNGKSYVSLAAGVLWPLTAKQTVHVRGLVIDTDYKTEHPAFRRVRSDQLLEARVGWSWAVASRWTTTVDLVRTFNDSNIDLYSYTRTQVMGGLRYAFDM